MKITQKYGMLPECTFGFIPGGAPEWPADLQAAVQWHSRRHHNPAFIFMLDATSAYDTVSHRSISTACQLYGVPPDVESLLLSHIRGHQRIVNTAYGLGDENHPARLEGGVAQGANSSPSLYIWATTAAHKYANTVLRGYTFSHDQPDDHGVRVGITSYADDEAGAVGGPGKTKEDAAAYLQNAEDGAQALTVCLTIAGVRTQHAKSMLCFSPAAKDLLGATPTITLTALNSNGQLIQAPAATVPCPGDIDGANAEARGAVKYVGVYLSWGDLTGRHDFHSEGERACRSIASSYLMSIRSVQPSLRVASRTAQTICYQRLRNSLLANPPSQTLSLHIRKCVALSGLSTLGLPGLLGKDVEHPAIDILLSPHELGGVGLRNPITCLCQDLAVHQLASLQHPSRTVREVAQQALTAILTRDEDFEDNGPSIEGDSQPYRRLDFLRHHGLVLHRGQQPLDPPGGGVMPQYSVLNHPITPMSTKIIEQSASTIADYRKDPVRRQVHEPWPPRPWSHLQPITRRQSPAAARAQSLTIHPGIAWCALNHAQSKDVATVRSGLPEGISAPQPGRLRPVVAPA